MPYTSWQAALFTEVTQRPRLTDVHLHQISVIAMLVRSRAGGEGGFSHQQVNVPASKQHIALLPTTHWPELNTGPA